MRKSTKIGLALLLAIGMAGCSNKKSKEEVQKEVTQKIMSLERYGFDVNKSDGSFILTVKDSRLLSQEILSLFNQQLLQPQYRQSIEELTNHAKFGVEVDWDKYAKHKENSVFVYYLGDGKESAGFQKFLSGKNLGAYLTFDDKDELKKAKSKDIDTVIGSTHYIYKGAELSIDKFAHNYKEPRKFKIDFGMLSLYNSKKDGKLVLDDSKCTFDQNNAYLGDVQCNIGKLMFLAAKPKMKLEIHGVKYDASTKASGSKISSNANFSIGGIKIDSKRKPGQHDSTKMDLSNLFVKMRVSNMDKDALDHLYETMEENVSAEKKTQDMLNSIAGMLSLGIDSAGELSCDKIDIKDAQNDIVSIDGYKADFKGSAGKTINFKWNSLTKSIHVASDKNTNKLDVSLSNYRFGYKIEDMYNYLPEFIKAMPKDGSGNIDDKKMEEIGQKIVNNGLKLGVGTVGFDSLKLKMLPMNMDLGKLTIDLNSELKANKLDMSNPMSQQLIMQYLSAGGKVVLKKKDFDQLLKLVPPSMGMMVSLFLKTNGDNAEFELKFENGHLTINGKKVM